MRGKTNLKTALVVSVFLLAALGISGYCEAQEPFIVADICPGVGDSYPRKLTNVNGTLFFQADDGTHGDELWKSDGTEVGTVMVADIDPKPGSIFWDPGSYPSYLTNVNGTLFFSAYNGKTGE